METTGSNVDQIPTKQGPEDGKLRLNVGNSLFTQNREEKGAFRSKIDRQAE